MKGILFKEEMYKASIEGRKTKTRRIITQPENSYGFQVSKTKEGIMTGIYAYDENERTIKPGTDQEWQILPRYRVGETVYMKEPYLDNQTDWGVPQSDGTYIKYKFDNFLPIEMWKNKLFMKAIHARNFIKILGVGCERLQDISESDCIAEGIEIEIGNVTEARMYKVGKLHFQSAKGAYEFLWCTINGTDSWDLNPFVFVYEFELVKL